MTKMDTSIVLGPLTPIKPMHASPKTMEEYRQSVRAWHLSKQRDTLAGIWDDPVPTRTPERVVTPPRSAISEDEEFGLRTSRRAINPLTGQPFVKSPVGRHATLPGGGDAAEVPSPRARAKDPTGMKSIYRSMAVYEDKPVSPRAAVVRDAQPTTPTRSREARASTSTQSSAGDHATHPPVLSASCSSCSSSSVASTRTDYAAHSGPSSPVEGLPLNMSNLAMANEVAVRSEEKTREVQECEHSVPASPYGVYAGGIIDLNTPARTPPSANRSRSTTVYPIIVHPSSRDGSPTPSRPRNIRHLTAGTDMTEESTSTSGESFAGLMESPWVTPGVMPTGKKSGNRLSAEIARMFAKQAASNSAAAAAAQATADARSPPGSGKTLRQPTDEPPSPACEAPPEFRFNAIEPHVGASPRLSDSAGSTPSSDEQDGARTSPTRRMFRTMTFQRPHSKSARAKGRGGNWTGGEPTPEAEPQAI